MKNLFLILFALVFIPVHAQIKWRNDRTEIYWEFQKIPLIVGEKLMLTPGDKIHNIIILNKNDGPLIWSSKAHGDLSAYCSSLYVHIFVDNTLLFQAPELGAVMLRLKNGGREWKKYKKNQNLTRLPVALSLSTTIFLQRS